MYCEGLISRVVCLVIRLVDIDRNRVAPLACHLAARVKTSHERLYYTQQSMNNKHQHVICTVKASYLEWYALSYVWWTSIATGWLRSLVT